MTTATTVIAAKNRPSPFSLAANLLEPEENRPRLQQYWYDPKKFVKDFFIGMKLKSYQGECIEQLLVRKKVCVRGPHSIGKTAMVSALVIWFALTREDMCRVNGGDWKVVTTASVERQLTKYLWPEIRKWTRKTTFDWDALGREPFDRRSELLYTQLKLEYGEAFPVSSDEPANIEGAHANHLLYIIDEAKTVRAETFDAIEGALLGDQEAYAFCISTPGEPNGRFYEIQSRQPGFEDWWVRFVTLAEAIKAGRITQEEVEQAKRRWMESSAIFKNRILGEFAVDSLDGLIPLAWVEAAMLRGATIKQAQDEVQKEGEPWQPYVAPEYSGLANCVSCDVARSGTDHNVIAVRVGLSCLPLTVFQSDDTMEVTGRVVGKIKAHGQREVTFAVVDVIGIGAGVVDRLREQGYDVDAFHGGSAVNFTDHSGELTFLNRRAAAWWGMRELLDPANPMSANVILPEDDILLGDLCTPRYKRTSADKIQVEEKDQIRKRLGRSPDRGDAVVMAYSDRIEPENQGGVLVYDDPVYISPY